MEHTVANHRAWSGRPRQSAISRTSGGIGKKLLSAKAMTNNAQVPWGLELNDSTQWSI